VMLQSRNPVRCARPWLALGKQTLSVFRSSSTGMGDTEGYEAHEISRAQEARPGCGVKAK
jgi:hypothetical protein